MTIVWQGLTHDDMNKIIMICLNNWMLLVAEWEYTLLDQLNLELMFFLMISFDLEVRKL